VKVAVPISDFQAQNGVLRSVVVLASRPVKKVLVCGALVLLAVGSGCTQGSSLRARSAGDMHCPAEQVLINRVDDRTFRVNGCGQEIVYISSCEPGPTGTKCVWVANTTSTDNRVAAGPGGSGCSFDNQCKGDRICVKGACVAPPPAANAAP
jgi:hypothetical protein